ncbi:TetR/AcrR family transcriptional regulator [Compostibacter hankyongensis]|uniref:HTH tetR-type domain-containing protein n=1 Tax=Compostibacter hankyongensis TaxID=1007089 RepID=A0ABP8G1X1_9BACT
MARQKKTDTDLSTEEKIKEAARKVFTRKGYAATRTRDIAEEAGINLALLNYYFRSKEKLFHQVMVEKVQQLFSVIAPIVNDSSISLESKISRIAESYIDMLLKHPDLPIFVLSELRNNVPSFMNIVHPEKLIRNSSLVTQLKKARPDINPLHFLANILGMVLFPFIAQPVFVAALALDARQFKQMMEERKQLIPAWVKAMLKTK